MSSRINAAQLSASLNSFIKQYSISNEITLIENFAPENDQREGYRDSYTVVYEALFESILTNSPQIEIWLTDEGNISLGIETMSRVLSRINKNGSVKRFVCGHEPVPVSIEELLAFLSILSEFDIQISLNKILKYFHKLLIPRDAYKKLANTFYSKQNWIAISSLDKNFCDNFYFKLSYDRWSRK